MGAKNGYTFSVNSFCGGADVSQTTPSPSAPWLKHYGTVPARLDYFEGSMWDGVRAAAERYPNYVAFDFMGRSTTYRRFLARVE